MRFALGQAPSSAAAFVLGAAALLAAPLGAATPAAVVATSVVSSSSTPALPVVARPADIPRTLVQLLAARSGSPDAGYALRLIARWAALSPAQRTASVESLETELRGLEARQAARLAAMLPLFDGQELPLTQAVDSWARADASACARWVRSRRPGPARDAGVRALSAMAQELAPADAANWALNELPAGELRDAAIAAALERWAADSPADAALWAQTTLEGAARGQATTRAVESWARRDPKAASEWVDTQASEPDTADSARSGVARAMAASKPAEAVAMAAAVESPEERQALLQGTLKRWHVPVARESKPKP